jgi:5'-nucleotidase
VALILLTNDDGIEAKGLRCLEEALRGVADLLVVAPDEERSAVSHGLTIRSPLSVRNISTNHFTLSGTPADCVIYALAHLSARSPDLVISGINHGANLGDDIMYSGTVAAAREASRHGIASMAVSQAYEEGAIRFEEGAKFARSLAKTMLEQKSNGGICLNVNIPVHKIRGIKITRQGCTTHFPHFNFLDRREPASSFTDAADLRRKSQIPLDFQAIVEDYISITPLQRDQTDYSTVPTLLKVAPKLYPFR